MLCSLLVCVNVGIECNEASLKLVNFSCFVGLMAVTLDVGPYGPINLG